MQKHVHAHTHMHMLPRMCAHMHAHTHTHAIVINHISEFGNISPVQMHMAAEIFDLLLGISFT